ncbi:mRNA cleavage and polyadenylation specificity factor complex subunit, partial [Plectosphaerella plurivora]
MASNLSVSDQLRQLNDARTLVLGDVKYYSNVVKSILQLVSPASHVELRRWAADFLAEAFATPALSVNQKETMQLDVLETLKDLLEHPNEDAQVLRSAIQAAASIYPIAIRWLISNSYDTMTWERVLAIKTRILKIWGTASSPVRICCIKFAQRVVLAQTPMGPNDPRRGDTLDVSLEKVPPNHQTLDSATLDAEAAGLLDRILNGLQEHGSDAITVDATLNCLSILVRARPTTANRILGAVFNFNPLKLANSPLTPRNRVLVRSMEKTTRMLLLHIAKRDPHHPMAARIQQHVEGMMRMRNEILEDAGRKRAPEGQPGVVDPKRQRMASAVPESQPLQIDPLPPGRHSLADVFTLTGNEGLKSFDITTVSADLVARINVSTLSRIDVALLAKATEGIRGRLAALAVMPPPELNPDTAPLGVDDDDDEYEPDFYVAEDTEQILNKLDGDARQRPDQSGLALKSFKLPAPPTLTPAMAFGGGQSSIMAMLEFVKTLEDAGKRTKSGVNRMAASNNDRESWMAIITRIASRSPTEAPEVEVKKEDEGKAPLLANSVREMLYNYVMEDFRRRIDVAITWLTEEWYADELDKKEGGTRHPQYEALTVRLIDGFSRYLHAQDKVLTRFLGELPHLTPVILSHIKTICKDPSVVTLVLTSLLYLVMMRPPAKEMALDTVQDIWLEFEDARSSAAKYLAKFRPGFVESATRDAKGDAAAPAAPTAVA